MKNIKIKTEKQNRLGAEMIIGGLGQISIPKDGIIEVPEDVAKNLIDSNIGWNAVVEKVQYKEVKKKAAPKKAEPKKVEPKVDEVVVEAVEEVAEVTEEGMGLENFTMKQLKDIAREGKLPLKEWKKIKSTKDMIAYIESKQ